MKLNKSHLVTAAVAGLLGSAMISHVASAADAAAPAPAAKGHCVGANSCKGKGACSEKGGHDCAGKNACKGKGWVENTKAECDALAKKDKKVKFEASNG